MSCRALIALLVTLTFTAAAAAQGTDTYPDRAIRIIVPFAPGGSTDVVGRTVAQKISEHLGQSVVVENRGGAATMLGTEFVVKARPDGYTLLIGVSSIATNPAMVAKMSYDAMKDLEPISLIARTPAVAYVNPSFAPQSLKELIELARKTPGGVSFGTGGTGTIAHLVGEQLRDITGAPLMHIGYKGGTPAMTDAIAGHIPMLSSTVGQALPQYKAKQLRALGVSSEQRYPSIPEVPTFREQGYDVVAYEWYGLFAPAGTPKPIVDKLSAEVRRMVGMQDLNERLAAIELVGSSPQELAAHVSKETAMWGSLIRKLGIRGN